MKKLLSLALAASLALGSSAAVPFVKGVTPTRLAPAKAVKYARAPQSQVVADEDFSKFSAGSETEPAAEIEYNNGWYVPDSMTAQPGWTGQGLHPAGGAVAVLEYTDENYGETRLGFISTPAAVMGGTVTVTFRAKAASDKAASIWLALCDDYYGPGDDQTDIVLGTEWAEYSFVATNGPLEDASYFQFQPEGGPALIDDIKVSFVRDRLAAPYALKAENLSPTSFKASWEPTDAPTYRLNIYSVSEATTINEGWMEENFNHYNAADGSGISEGWSIVNAGQTTVDEEGNIRIAFDSLGDSIVTAATPEPMDALEVWLRPLGEEAEDAETVSLLRVEIHHAATDSWEVIAHLPGYWMNPDGGAYEFQSEALGDDADCVRLTVIQLGGCTFLVDDIAVHYRTRGVNTPVVENLDTEATEYILENIDPKAEYYYYVQAVDGEIVSANSNLVWVDGIVGLPVIATEATDVTPTSFTANWQKLGHATSYKVEGFRVINAVADMPGTTILEESFDGITSAGSDWNPTYDFGANGMAASSWCATQPVWEAGMAGSNGTSWFGSAGLVYSPVLKLSGNEGKGFNVEATVVSTVAGFDYNGQNYQEGIIVGVLNTPQDNQFVSAQTIECPTVGSNSAKVFIPAPEGADFSNVIVAFMSMSGQKFFVDNVKISQDLKAGESVVAPFATVITDQTSHAFSGLDSSIDHAYAVTASTSRNYETFKSERSEIIEVKNAVNAVESIEVANDEAAFFNLQGIRCEGKLTPGLYIRRAGNACSKVIVK